MPTFGALIKQGFNAIAANAGQLANTAINAFSTAAANNSSMNFQQGMYERQRMDALADWNRNNEYNSPMAQMARLKQAGLNPAIFYGGGSGAIQTAQPIRSSSPGSYRAEVMKPDLGNFAQNVLDMISKKETIKNIQAQNDLIHAQAEETRSRIPKNQVETKSGEFDLGVKQELRDNTIAIARNNLTKLYAETEQIYNNMDLAKQKNLREIALSREDIKLKVAETAKLVAETKNIDLTRDEIMARINNLGLDATLKAMEIAAREKGWSWHDGAWQRILLSAGNKIAVDINGSSTEKAATDRASELIRNKNPFAIFSNW